MAISADRAGAGTRSSVETGAGPGDARARALLFDRDEVADVGDWTEQVGRLRRSQILWIDVRSPGEDTVAELARVLGLHETSAEHLWGPAREPFFGQFDGYVHVTASAPASSEGVRRSLERVGCLVSESWVLTVHDGDVAVLETFRARAEGAGETGSLDGLDFLAALLEWVLEAYLEAFEAIEVGLEDIDERVMRGELDEPEKALDELVERRREIGSLRRALVSHRRMLLSLTQPDVEFSGSAAPERFATLRERLEYVVQAARDTRDSAVGSFDVLIARTSYRTNEIMKVLTLVSVLLLPGALVAGVLGMNFRVGFFERAWLFWVVVGAILAAAAATVGAARSRRWI